MVLFWESEYESFGPTFSQVAKNPGFSSQIFFSSSRGRDCIFIAVDINQGHKCYLSSKKQYYLKSVLSTICIPIDSLLLTR